MNLVAFQLHLLTLMKIHPIFEPFHESTVVGKHIQRPPLF